ncbi:MAG TPA: hypothetical protein VK843_09560 [Planctomycetota bacterium]|nr:hypothetical protein [Planctomycetota bacterium]
MPLPEALLTADTPAPSSPLVLSSAEDFRLGPDNDFDPDARRRTYSLINNSTELVNWGAHASEPWVSFAGPSNGALQPGESAEISVEVDPFEAQRSGEEQGIAQLVFTNLDTSMVAAQARVLVHKEFLGGGVVNGWTRFQASVDTRRVFVSNTSGNDQNDGLSPATAVRSLAAGKALMRHGYPDWMLLERGSVWHESLGQWIASGRSPAEPMLISTYGASPLRALLETGTEGGIRTNGGNGSPATIDNLAVVGLHFHASAYTGGGDCIGAQMLQPGSHILFEDCEFQGYSGNLVFQGYGGRHKDFSLRRSVIIDAYAIHSIGGHSQGLYAYAVDGLLIEENLFDHNGWNESVPGAGADIFSHNLYIDNDNTAVTVRGNIIANASSHGMQLRPGGSVVNNVFVRNSIALSVGGGNNPEVAGVVANVVGNVILDGKNIDAANPRGWGLWFANIASGRVRHNLIANNTLGSQPNVMTLCGTHVGDTHSSIGVHNLAIQRNVLFNWAGSIRIEGDSWQVSNVSLSGNDVQSTNSSDCLIEEPVANSTVSLNSFRNRFFSQLAPTNACAMIGSVAHPLSYWFGQIGDTTSTIQQVGYAQPNRSAATYNGVLGGPSTLDAFLQQARQQASRNWRPEYSAVSLARYMRAGF